MHHFTQRRRCDRSEDIQSHTDAIIYTRTGFYSKKTLTQTFVHTTSLLIIDRFLKFLHCYIRQ